MMWRRLILVGLAALGTAGCMEQMDPISLVSKFRVMAVQADPPEIRPGEGTTLRVLISDPEGDGREIQVAWFGCIGEFNPSAGAENECAPLGFATGVAGRGGEVFQVPPVPLELRDELYLPSDNPLKDPSEDKKKIYIEATVVVTLCAGGEFPADMEGSGGIDDSADICEGGDGLTAIKTFRISEQEEANRNSNPVVDTVSFDDKPLAEASVDEGGEIVLFKCDNTEACLDGTKLKATLTGESFQRYEEVQLGSLETVDESPYISWFVTGGDLGSDRSRAAESDMMFSNTWHPPIQGGEFTLWAVAHDLRGGTSWKQYAIGAVTSE